MTREEAVKKAQILDFQGGYTIGLVCEIYNDFESRNCASCKHLDNDTGKSYSNCDLLQITIGCETKKEFYCAYWEAKDK